MPPVMLQKASNISRSAPFHKLTQNRLFNKTSPGAVKVNNKWRWLGVDNKPTTQQVSSKYLDSKGNFNEKGYGKSRYGRLLDMLPKWVRGSFGWAARKMPAVAAVLAGWDAWNIMNTPGLPMEDVPGKPSKLQSLFTLLGNVAGLTVGSIAGGLFGGIPGLLVGAWGGGAAGTHLGQALYEGMWLKNYMKMSNEELASHFGNSLWEWLKGGNRTTTDPSQAMIPETRFEPDITGVSGHGTLHPTGKMIENPKFIDVNKVSDRELLTRHLGVSEDILNRNRGNFNNQNMIINNNNEMTPNWLNQTNKFIGSVSTIWNDVSKSHNN